MASALDFRNAFIYGLRDTYDAECQIVQALPSLLEAARSPELRAVFQSQLEEALGHAARLEQVLWRLGKRVRGEHCEGIAGILAEGRAILADDLDDATMDARLIACAQRVAHYTKAAYTTLVAWADAMGHGEVTHLLRRTLDEETCGDKALSWLADGRVSCAVP
jgi:ferritin-like metal-binding protein YciE